MKRILFSLVLVTLVLSVVLVGYVAEEKLVWDKSWPTKVRISTGNIGGGSYMCGSAFVNVLSEEFPGVTFISQQGQASVANVKVIEVGDVEFGTCTADVAYEAWNGVEGPSFNGVKYQNFRILMPRTRAPQMIVTLKKNNITDVNQFSGKYSGVAKGGAVDVFVRALFDGLDIDLNIINLSVTDSVESLKSGVIEGFTIGHPNTAVRELALTHEIEVIGISEEDAKRFLKAYPKYSYPMTVPAGYYKGVDEPVKEIGLDLIFIARADLPEEMVYTVLKAWYKHPEIIKATWPVLIEGTNPDSVKGISHFAPLHKGSIKYYEEIGVDIGENAILLNE